MKTKYNRLSVFKSRFLTVVICALLLSFYSFRHRYVPFALQGQSNPEDSTIKNLQQLIDSLYGQVQDFSDKNSKRDDLQQKIATLNMQAKLLDDTLRQENNFDFTEICNNISTKEGSQKVREKLQRLCRHIGSLERESDSIQMAISLSKVAFEGYDSAIKKARPTYLTNRDWISQKASRPGPGYIEINKTRYFFYVVDFKTDAVQILNNAKKSGGQSIAEVLNKLKANNKEVSMITNGGMYTPQFGPQGLLIEDFKELKKLDTLKPDNKINQNFYLQPNGVFYIDSLGYNVLTTDEFKTKFFKQRLPKYATQSGPMLIVNGKRNNNFKNGSTNLNIRSGIGFLNQKSVVFIISESRVNFYDFAGVFENVFNCKSALYLDGAISSMYLNLNNGKSTQINSDGAFGPIIYITKIKKTR